MVATAQDVSSCSRWPAHQSPGCSACTRPRGRQHDPHRRLPGGAFTPRSWSTTLRWRRRSRLAASPSPMGRPSSRSRSSERAGVTRKAEFIAQAINPPSSAPRLPGQSLEGTFPAPTHRPNTPRRVASRGARHRIDTSGAPPTLRGRLPSPPPQFLYRSVILSSRRRRTAAGKLPDRPRLHHPSHCPHFLVALEWTRRSSRLRGPPLSRRISQCLRISMPGHQTIHLVDPARVQPLIFRDFARPHRPTGPWSPRWRRSLILTVPLSLLRAKNDGTCTHYFFVTDGGHEAPSRLPRAAPHAPP